MVLLLFAAIVFIFLLLGSLVFVVCATIPPTRKYALSAALWCAVWGPCLVGFLTLAGIGLVATAFITKAGDVQSFHAPRLLETFGWGYLIFGILTTASVATGVSWLHQKLVRRFTFALFRLYATVVCAGIGSVFGWALGWWMSNEGVKYGFVLWPAGMLVLIAAFATAAYKWASQLRGKAPTTFTWISADEFAGDGLQ
jgi:hypothetical protein